MGPRRTALSFARELSGEQRRLRAVGLDWPLQGVSMSGLRRLDDLETCVDSVVRDGVEGDLIEAGTWRGGATILMRAALDSSPEDLERTVWVADSFQGFPEAETETPELCSRAICGPSSSSRCRSRRFATTSPASAWSRTCEFVKGFFKDTLPGLGGRWALVRLDGDTYEATRVALESLYPGLSPGGYLIVDDYAIEECRRAVDEFRDEHGIDEPIEEIDWTCVRWRRGAESGPPAVGERPDDVEIPPAPSPRVPNAREVELTIELEALRDRLEDAEAALRRAGAEGVRVRDGYERSLSWRATRPLRSGARIARSLARRRSR